MMVIETTFKPIWPVPVQIRIGAGRSKQVKGPEDALYYITNRWPSTKGNRLELARLSCMRMLKRQERCDDARSAFVSAALEANVLVL
jgi:hypothetical protein